MLKRTKRGPCGNAYNAHCATNDKCTTHSPLREDYCYACGWPLKDGRCSVKGCATTVAAEKRVAELQDKLREAGDAICALEARGRFTPDGFVYLYEAVCDLKYALGNYGHKPVISFRLTR